jgi:prefoldin alpha subunit
MNEQEYYMKMQMLGQEAEKIEQQVQIIDQQNMELMAVRESIAAMNENKEKEILANLGKGIFVKADIKDHNLFVNVGKDVLVKKTPDEAIKIIDDQLVKLTAGKEQFIGRIEELQEEMQSLLMDAQRHQRASGDTHSHGCEDESCGCDEECSGCEDKECGSCENEDCACEEPCKDCKCDKDAKKGKKK